jgi:hypothetical protein
MLGLALHMTRAFDASHDSHAVIPSADALQLLWLGHHSAPAREVLEEVEYPTDADLRRAGMRDVCFAKKICKEGIQLSVRNFPDIFRMSSTIHTLYCSPIAILVQAFSEVHSNNPQEYASDAPWMISTRTCCMLHGILVAIHVLLTISYIFHWEHHVTLPSTPTNNNLWSVVLSASLQAFYTVRVPCYVISMINEIALLDLHCSSTLPYPTAYDFQNTCTAYQTNFHPRHIWCMVGPWLCTQQYLATNRHPCLMVDGFLCCNLPCVHFRPACRLFHSRTISNVQYYSGNFCADGARLAG